MSRFLSGLALATLALGWPAGAAGQEWLCDPKFQDCREPLLNLIRNESQGIDVAFWYMEDARYVTELIDRHNAGVPVRVIMDESANTSHPPNAEILRLLRESGIPMRDKNVGDIVHYKMMLFDGQDIVQFSKANYIGYAFVPVTPGVDFHDEAIFFTDDPNLTNSFRRRFDDLWIDSSRFRNYSPAGSWTPTRRYSDTLPVHWSMNFPPGQDFAVRSVERYNAEPQGIDAAVFRVTDHRHANALISAANNRGVSVRLISERSEYRNPDRVWHAKHIDRMYMCGSLVRDPACRIQIKHGVHAGIMHQASVVLHGLGEVIFGSSNWTTASASWQEEHNYFYEPSLGKQWFFDWFRDQFEEKWNDAANYVPFQPLPPTNPNYYSPANGATGQSTTSVTLSWDGGNWAHLYDIYFGTSSNPPQIVENMEIGSPLTGLRESFTVSNLQPGTTYYWRIVGKTWAMLTNSGSTWSFTTAGSPPPGGGSGPYGGTPENIPGTFQAENFDEGGQNVAYNDTTSGNRGGAYRTTDVDLEGTTDAGGGYNLGWTKAGEWLRYTVNVGTTGTYTLETRVSNSGSGARFRVEVDGVNVTGSIPVPDTGGWQSWQTVSTPGISLTAGLRVIRVVFETATSLGSVGNYNWFRLLQGTLPPPPPPGNTPFGGTPWPVPGTFQAENFDEGGQNVAYNDTTSGNRGGAYRTTDVDLEGTTDANGGYNLGWTKAGEWLKYTVNVGTTGTYTLETRVSNSGSGARFRVEVDGVNVTGSIAVPDTGGWQSWQTVSTPGISLTAGQRVIRVVFETATSLGSVGNYNWLRFVQGSTATSTAYWDPPVSLPGTIQAEDFDHGGQNVAYLDVSAGNSGGEYRTGDVDIGATTDGSSGGYFLGWARVGEWVKYTVEVTETRDYSLNVHVANDGSGAAFGIEVDGIDRTGAIPVPDTGGWDVWQTVAVEEVPLTAGQRVLRMVMLARNEQNSSVGNFGHLSFQ